MPLQYYLVRCYNKKCLRAALYKIASRWSDGVTSELKTYSLCCKECLPLHFGDSQIKQAACRLAPGETLELPGIYRICRGAHDYELERQEELEEEMILFQECVKEFVDLFAQQRTSDAERSSTPALGETDFPSQDAS